MFLTILFSQIRSFLRISVFVSWFKVFNSRKSEIFSCKFELFLTNLRGGICFSFEFKAQNINPHPTSFLKPLSVMIPDGTEELECSEVLCVLNKVFIHDSVITTN